MSRYQSRSGGLWAQLVPLLPTLAPPHSPAVLIPAHLMASTAIKFHIKEGCNWPWWQREPGESTQQTISLAPGEFRVGPKKTQYPDQKMPVQSLLDRQHNTCSRHPPIQCKRRRCTLLDHQQKSGRCHPHRHQKMKIMRVGINESIRFKFLSIKKTFKQTKFSCAKHGKRNQNGGTKQDKKWQ